MDDLEREQGPISLPDDVRRGVFVVVAAFNEGPCVADVVREIRAAYPNVVVVDDGSTDDTFEKAKSTATYTLRHLINRGQGAALQTGFTFALPRGAQYVVSFDADGQHRTQDIARLIQPIADGTCDIALGSRFIEGARDIPFGRRLLLRLAVLFTRIVNRVPLTDTHNGLRAFSARAAAKLDLTLDRMAHASEMLDQIRQSGYRFVEVPVKVRYTEYSIRKGQNARGALRIVIHYLLGKVFP